MSALQVAWLALLQGLTEFLPVSSSGHLRVLERAFGVTQPLTAFDVTLHLATLLSVLVFLLVHERALVVDLLLLRRRRLIAAIVTATIPTGLLGLSVGVWAEVNLTDLVWVGGAFGITAGILWSTRGREARATQDEPTLRDAFVIGIAQGIGVFRGISRSGITIAAGLHRGLKPEAAFSFSFLLAIPAILGAFVLEARHIGDLGMPLGHVLLGFVVAFVTGYAALVWLRRLVVGGRFWLFAFYVLGAAVLVLGLRAAGALA